MKVSLSWLKELTDLKLSPEELADKLSLVSIGVKDQNSDYLELDLTYNRGDLLSQRGVAREVAAITDTNISFSISDESKLAWTGKDLPKIPIEIEDENLCPVYCIAKIEGLKVEKSSEASVKKLISSGVRSINNIADVTNLIMLEFGQPMHAFDSSVVKEEKIYVRGAKVNEKITTIDGKTRNLDSLNLLITDSENILGIAGVMGGKDSEISSSTISILLEAAIFDPVSIRNTSKKQGLYSEASKRFQHGLTKTNLLQALSAAIKRYEDLGGELTAISLVGDLTDKPKTIKLTEEKINSLIGADIPSELIESSLSRLGFTLTAQGKSWVVTVPYWRLDVNIEEDLIEEVARMYGYDRIEGQPLKDVSLIIIDQTLPKFLYTLKLKLKELGLSEVQTYSFFSTHVFESLEFSAEYKEYLIKVANPISAETTILRQNIWPNLVETVGKNLRKGYNDIGIFEIGKSYNKSYDGKEIPKEQNVLSIALCNGSDNPLSELISILEKMNLNLKLKASPVHKIMGNLFHPRRFMQILLNNKEIGGAGEVHLRELNKMGIEKRVAVLELVFFENRGF